MKAADIAERLAAKHAGPKSWTARCPAHEDRTPSLSIAEGDNGGTLLHCHAGCTVDQVLAAIDMATIDLSPPTFTTNGYDEIVYRYTDATGTLLYEVVRKPGKKFLQRRPDGAGGWIWKRSERLVLYNLQRVLKAVANGDTVIICEGEKDAERVIAEGYCATTNPMGAGKWSMVRDHAREVLKGADVIVVRDKDEPGRKHAAEVVAGLHGVAASVMLVEPAEGKDVSDHLADGLTIDDLIEVTNNGGEPPGEPDAAAGTRQLANVPKWAPIRLAECCAVYQRWLHLPDNDQVIAAVGAAAANLLPGDPLWLLFVGVPGSGKTETIHPLAVLPYVHSAATMTEAALLSGTPAKEKAKGARGGLLRELGDFGIILVKDFSGVLTMNRDARAAVLSALREVYDGSWTRRIGVDGGRSLEWTGKAGFIGAVTPSIDRHHAVMGALGERFVLYRLAVTDPKAQARRRLGNRGHETTMRAELADAVAGVLAGVDRATPPRRLADTEVDRLVDLATFIVRARTAVERDGYDREVVVMPSAEAPGRLIGALGAFLSGLEVVGADNDTAWRIVTKAGWDCVPDMRCRLLFELRQHPHLRTAELVAATGIPTTTAARTIEDMALLGLIDRTKGGTHDTAAWVHSLSAQTDREWP